MSAPRARVLAVWLAMLAIAGILAARARFTADVSGFLPVAPTAEQRLLVEQLGKGPASRILLLAIEGADAATRARLSHELAARVRGDARFTFAGNGELQSEDGEFLLRHRYALSDGVTPERFTVDGLHEAIEESLFALSGPAGLLLSDLLVRDPTGEVQRIASQADPGGGPRVENGVWTSRDGARALLVVRTAAGGSDTDGQQAAVQALRSAFAGASPSGATLTISGPGVFAVEARAAIVDAAVRLSLIGAALTFALLLYVYRSPSAVLLGLVPIASGALTGIAAVATGFGTVHGLTLGFGITLIGEAVDYAIYLFVQLGAGNRDEQREAWRRDFWPTIRLGMLTSLCGFAALLFSGFPGLAQLGLYSVAGLLTASLVTRHVLPALLPATYRMRDLAPWGLRLRDAARAARAWRGRVVAIAATGLAAAAVLIAHRHDLWQQELASLSPVPAAEQQRDAVLRGELGAAEVAQAVIVAAGDRETALRGAERVAAALTGLVDSGAIGGFESPTRFLPSDATQAARRAALPGAAELRERLAHALEGLPLRPERLAPFLQDVEVARSDPPITAASLQGTSFAAVVESLLLRSDDGWHVLLPLRAGEDGAAPDIAAVRDAVAGAGVAGARVLDLKQESDALYRGYLHETVRLALVGLAAVLVVLAVALRSPARACRVAAPLLLAVLCTMALLVASGRQVSLLHVVGLLLIVAVGSNYALFFDGAARGAAALDRPSTYASVLLACLATVVGFGVLAFAGVPVLTALGETVAIGGVLALLFSALLSGPRRTT